MQYCTKSAAYNNFYLESKSTKFSYNVTDSEL